MIGSVIGGKYRIVRRIGAGGMGTVYEAVHTQTGRAVALKILKSDRRSATGSGSDAGAHDTARAYETEMSERFKREALATGLIVSEHVVQVLDADTDTASAAPFIVMELLNGETVQDLAKRVRVLHPRAALAIAAQTCEGLRAAHAAGIVHRDVKTPNLLLAEKSDGGRVVKVLDFGIAKVEMERFSEEAATGLTLTGSVLGSPQFMAPEQARGLKTIDHRADLWSLGVVLYRLLTGALPFGGVALAQILLEICSDEPQPVRARAPWVLESTASVVMRALRKDPDERWPSAEELLVALHRELALVGGSEGSALRDSMLVPPTELEMSVVPDGARSFGASGPDPSSSACEESVTGASEPRRLAPRRWSQRRAAWFVGATAGGGALALALVLANRAPTAPAFASATSTDAARIEPLSSSNGAEVVIRASPVESSTPSAAAGSVEPVPSAPLTTVLAPSSGRAPAFTTTVRAAPTGTTPALSVAPTSTSPAPKPSGHVGGTTTFE